LSCVDAKFGSRYRAVCLDDGIASVLGKKSRLQDMLWMSLEAESLEKELLLAVRAVLIEP
jgi:hypothetical protein